MEYYITPLKKINEETRKLFCKLLNFTLFFPVILTCCPEATAVVK